MQGVPAEVGDQENVRWREEAPARKKVDVARLTARKKPELRRNGYQALRKLALTAYYMEESSWGPLDYQPPPSLRAIAYDDSQVGTPEWLRARASGDAP